MNLNIDTADRDEYVYYRIQRAMETTHLLMQGSNQCLP